MAPTEPVADLIGWLDGHTNLEALSIVGHGPSPTLDRMSELCRALGDPQLGFPVVHITGTNGKGSTARILASVLQASGLSVGVFTSPDLNGINERIARNAEPIDDDSLAEVLTELKLVEDLMSVPVSRFELLTAAAFLWFADAAVDVAVVEVGLGGRWDSTNVVVADVAVVTNISYDHVEILGPTLEDIASEKAGIFKHGSRVVIGEADQGLKSLLIDKAKRAGAESVWTRDEQPGSDLFGV